MINKIVDIKLAIIGLGYVGLPLALEFAKKKTPNLFERMYPVSPFFSILPPVPSESV